MTPGHRLLSQKHQVTYYVLHPSRAGLVRRSYDDVIPAGFVSVPAGAVQKVTLGEVLHFGRAWAIFLSPDLDRWMKVVPVRGLFVGVANAAQELLRQVLADELQA